MLHSKPGAGNWLTAFINDTTAGCEGLRRPSECDVDIGSFTTLSYLDHRRFCSISSIRSVRVEATVKRRATGVIHKIVFVALSRRNLIAARGQAKHAIDSPIIGLNA